MCLPGTPAQVAKLGALNAGFTPGDFVARVSRDSRTTKSRGCRASVARVSRDTRATAARQPRDRFQSCRPSVARASRVYRATRERHSSDNFETCRPRVARVSPACRAAVARHARDSCFEFENENLLFLVNSKNCRPLVARLSRDNRTTRARHAGDTRATVITARQNRKRMNMFILLRFCRAGIYKDQRILPPAVNIYVHLN